MADFKKISTEQFKLLGSAVRTQILHLLHEKPRSAKQVADILRQSPGSIHYHVQKLYDGGLISLEHTAEVNGIIEKYYVAETVCFDGGFVPDSEHGEKLVGALDTRMLFSQDELSEFKSDIRVLMGKWEERLATALSEGRAEVHIRMSLHEVTGGDS